MSDEELPCCCDPTCLFKSSNMITLGWFSRASLNALPIANLLTGLLILAVIAREASANLFSNRVLPTPGGPCSSIDLERERVELRSESKANKTLFNSSIWRERPPVPSSRISSAPGRAPFSVSSSTLEIGVSVNSTTVLAENSPVWHAGSTFSTTKCRFGLSLMETSKV